MIKLMVVMMMMMMMMITAAESQLYNKCFQGGYCFYTTGKLTNQQSIQNLQQECSILNSKSRVLELHDHSIQQDFRTFMEGNNLKPANVFINLMRVDQPWSWLDGSKYIVQKGPRNTKEFFVDINSGNFASVNRLSLKILSYPNADPKSLLSKLDHFLCSFQGPCDQSKEADKFQVEYMCYTYHTMAKLNWMDAYNQCSSRKTSLAILPPDLLTQFKAKAKPLLEVNKPYWIGLSKLRWQWYSKPGKPIDFYNWYNGYPRPSLITANPSDVYACVQPRNAYIWVDYARMPNVTLVCMTKSSDEDWKNGEIFNSDGNEENKHASDENEENKHASDTYTVAKGAVIAVPLVLALLLIASLIANAVLAVMLCSKSKEPKAEEKKGSVNEYFNYE